MAPDPKESDPGESTAGIENPDERAGTSVVDPPTGTRARPRVEAAKDGWLQNVGRIVLPLLALLLALGVLVAAYRAETGNHEAGTGYFVAGLIAVAVVFIGAAVTLARDATTQSRADRALKMASLLSDPNIDDDIRAKLIAATFAAPVTTSSGVDRYTLRALVYVLGLIAAGSVALVAILLASGTFTDTGVLHDPQNNSVLKDAAGHVIETHSLNAIPDIFLAIGSVAVGALAGLLAPSPASVANGTATHTPTTIPPTAPTPPADPAAGPA